MAPSVELSTDTINFGHLYVQQSGRVSFFASNQGASNTTVEFDPCEIADCHIVPSGCPTPSTVSAFASGALTFTLEANKSFEFDVVLSPKQVATLRATVHVRVNGQSFRQLHVLATILNAPVALDRTRANLFFSEDYVSAEHVTVRNTTPQPQQLLLDLTHLPRGGAALLDDHGDAVLDDMHELSLGPHVSATLPFSLLQKEQPGVVSAVPIYLEGQERPLCVLELIEGHDAAAVTCSVSTLDIGCVSPQSLWEGVVRLDVDGQLADSVRVHASHSQTEADMMVTFPEGNELTSQGLPVAVTIAAAAPTCIDCVISFSNVQTGVELASVRVLGVVDSSILSRTANLTVPGQGPPFFP